MRKIPFSVLDLAPVPVGNSAEQALKNTTELAQHVDALGFNRYWLAEHHNMPGIASAATAVVVAQVAAHTKRIRVGSGGIMLSNHAPLIIAEQFGTLAALYPGRIDLGIGRAPGTDQYTAAALRRDRVGDDRFPQDVLELQSYFHAALPGQRIRAVPGEGADVPIWLLGSSTYSAELAALLGLRFAFASHFAPALIDQALEIYRSNFRPSAGLAEPYAMIGVNVFAAETNAQANRLFSSLQQAFINLRRGQPGKLPEPHAIEGLWSRAEQAMLDQALACSVVGDEATVRRGLIDLIETHQPDELMITAQIHDPQARRHSYSIVATLHDDVQAAIHPKAASLHPVS
jgi:luciferase family oxidoreductase group 1